MGFGTQLKLLLWKNFTLRKRQPVRVAVELIWPLILFLILALVKTRGLQEYIHECHFDGKAMPSAGPLPFIQGVLCTSNNTCHETATPDELAGRIQTFDNSLLYRFYGEVQDLLSNNTYDFIIENIIEDIETLSKLRDHVQNGTLDCAAKVGNLLVNTTELRQRIEEQGLPISQHTIDTLINSSLNWTEIFQLMLQNRDNLVNNPEEIRDLICGQQDLLLEYPDTEQLHRTTGQLCNLTVEEYRQLYEDFMSELDPMAVRAEIEKCLQDTLGKGFAVDNATIQAGLRFIRDLRKLQSLQDILSELNDTVTDAYQDGVSMQNRSMNASLVSQLFCGRSSGVLLGADEGKNMFRDARSQDGPQVFKSKSDDDKPENDTRTTEFCNDLFNNLKQNQYTRILWRQVKPLIRGRIPYTPNTPTVNKIIKKANETFEELARLKKLAQDWMDIAPNVSDFIQNNQGLDIVRLYLDIAHTEYPDNRIINTYRRWLNKGPEVPGQYDWRDSINYTSIAMAQLKKYLDCFEFNKFEPYDSEEELIKVGLEYIEDQLLWAGIVFKVDEGQGDVGTHVSYKIRMDTDRIDSTRRVLDRYWSPGPRRRPAQDLKYVTSGYAYLQDMIEHGIIVTQTGADKQSDKVGVYVQQFPYPCYIDDIFTMAIARSMPMFMVLAWIYTVAMVVKGIVYEKEQRLKEVMKVMGLGNGVHWLAWFITCFIMMFISIIMLLIVLKGGKVLEHSNPMVILLFLLAFTVATIMQCFLFSVFFSKANVAAACGGVFYFIGYLPYTLIVQWEELMTFSQKALGCLSSTVAFGFGCSYIARYEEQGIGIQFDNMARSPIPEDSYSMLGCIVMMLLDAFIYWVLTWYIEAVFPGQYGVPRVWYFPVTRSYWCGKGGHYPDITAEDRTYEMDPNNTSSGDFETEPQNERIGVAIRGMKKIYKRGQKVAVDGLTLNFFEGQITSFLGHNGAGKTTTMSVLTGLFPPTQGTALIYNKDIRSDMEEIRKSMGMCPQHNVLYDTLTVDEQIWFYACLKGLESQQVKTEIEQMVQDVGLVNKRNEQAKNLSGGMKRKLSVALAFVAGSRVVILDEPTAGVDPYARRSIWELVLKYRQGRTIILSTHFMDEADILGDRIAIISQGKLCCCGSSLFLKSRFGSGYYLTLVKKEAKANGIGAPLANGDVKKPDIEREFEKDDSMDVVEETGGATSESSLTRFIQEYVPQAKLVESVGSELCYQLPSGLSHCESFQQLFTALDSKLTELDISSYGISDTTLEEVFLKVAEDNDVDEERKRTMLEDMTDGGQFARPVTRLSFRRKRLRFLNKTSGDLEDLVANDELDMTTQDYPGTVRAQDVENCNGAGSSRVTGHTLIWHQFLALFVKRFHYVRRSKKGFVSQVILPAVFICLAMVFAMIVPPMEQEPPLELYPWQLSPRGQDKHLYMFYSNDEPESELANSLERLLVEKPGIGTRCMDKSIYSIDGLSCEDVPTSDDMWKTPVVSSGEEQPCSCETGHQVCPEGAAGPEPSRRLLPSTDILYNMTGRNITEWLLKTNAQYLKKRYGGLSFGETNRLQMVNITALDSIFRRIATADQPDRDPAFKVDLPPILEDIEEIINTMETKRNAKVWFNNKGYPAMVSYMNVLNNLLLRSQLPRGKDPNEYGITAINHPMNRTRKQVGEETLKASAIDVLIAISVIFAMSFIPASFVLFLIEERVSNSKHLQLVSGVNPIIYWVANFCWDMVNYLIPAILCILIFVAFQKEAYVSARNAPCLIALLLLYGWAVTPMMYPACYIFKVPSSAFVGLACLNVFLGIISTITTFTLELFDDQELTDINNILRQVFLLLPHYCLGRGLIDMTRQQLIADALSSFGETLEWDPFAWNLVGRNLLCMAVQGFGFFLLNLVLQYKCFCKPRKVTAVTCGHEAEDEDVARERERVMSGQADQDMLRIEELMKVYKKKSMKHPAVDRIAVGVAKGECFGLLGVNGAGKTTTFRMLTGDTRVTSGNAHLAGHSILTDMVQVHQNLGYCPQFDALSPLLTGREHLQFYSRLRGVPEQDVNTVAEWAIQRLGLSQYADRVAGDYSGGNKRKLSTAIALVGNPPVIFLDEPTTGMDPGARRFLWNCIMKIIKEGRSVILTSHSMEECEALCTRVAIMVNGRFKCLGSIQHLKNKYGCGYMLILRVAGHNPNMEPVMQYIQQAFPDATRQELHHNMVQYQLGTSETSLASIFGKMESVREEYQIEDYSVSQTTLDQVFINFAKQQTDDVDDGQAASAAAAGAMRSHKYKHGNLLTRICLCCPLAPSVVRVKDELAPLHSDPLLWRYGRANGATAFDPEESLSGSRINLVLAERGEVNV